VSYYYDAVIRDVINELLEEQNSTMEKITVNKADLLAKLQANRNDHQDIYQEALDGFAEEATRELEEQLQLLREGKRRDLRVIMQVPRDHTGDYDRAIAMIEMSLGDTVTLSETDFAQYVMDDWGWQSQFLSNVYGSTRAYSKFDTRYEVS
jgi:hypothetical protein